MTDLEQLIVEQTSMTLEQARAYLREVEMNAWRELGARRREGAGE